MPSSSLSWQQGLAGRNPAISFLTSAENEMPTTSQGWCPATRTLFLPSSPPKVQSTEPVTARAPGTDLQPHTLLALYHTMVMARAIRTPPVGVAPSRKDGFSGSSRRRLARGHQLRGRPLAGAHLPGGGPRERCPLCRA